MAILVVIALVTAGLTIASTVPAEAAITTPFAKMFSTNTSGNIQIRGNTLVTCQATATKCATARNASATTAANGDLNNNAFFMTYVDVDGDAATFDSSSASVATPAGASVLYAALTWGGNTAAGSVISSGNGPAYGIGTPAIAPTPGNAGQAKLKVPGESTYRTIPSTRTTFLSGTTGSYQGFADVTSLITAAGNGSYTVADVQTGTGGNEHAGWALTIAYANPADPPRNLTIFAGFGTVMSAETADITVSGFQTPLTGDVKTTLGAVSYEGDAGSVGDQLQLGNTTADLKNVTDATHPLANTFASAISDNGIDGSTRAPSYKNQLGYDQATFVMDPADNYLKNDASSAVIRLTSNAGGETYYPGIVTFATELYSPNLVATKSVAVVAKAPGNIQSGLAEPGDTLRYTVTGVNNGKDDAVGVVLTDAIPAGTTYVSGSLKVGGVAKTDVSGDDVGSYALGPPTVRVNLGTGAGNGTTPADGGKVLIGAATAPVTFDVTINGNIADGAAINNQAQLTYRGFLNNLAVAGASNAVTAAAVRRHSELAVTKTADLPLVQKGAATSVTYTLTTTNSGPYDDPGVTVTDTLPAGATVVRATPSAGTCTFPANKVLCDLGALANGRFATVDVEVTLDSAADPATDSVTAAGTNVDDNLGDNTATRSTAVNTAPVAVDDTATTSGGAATINVRSNDSDADGDPLTVSAGLVSPAKGSVVVNANQTITYTADAGTVGADSFTYTVSDGRGGASTATVRITIPNGAPQAQPDDTTTLPRVPVTVAVLDNDTDPNVPGQTLSVSGVTQPAGARGTVTTNGTTVTFTPSASFLRGTATFTYTLSDGAGGTDTATVTVTIAETSPKAADDTATTAYATPVTVDVLANDTDDNGDPLTVTTVVGAAHGTATITGTGAGTRVRYTPAAGWSGTDTMTYTITDGTTSTTAELTVITGNGSPVAGNYSVTVDGGTTSTLDPVSHASDPNGDALTLVGAGGASHGSVRITADGRVEYLPVDGYLGPDSFDYTVSDGEDTATGTVSVTVRNQAPQASNDTVQVPINRSVTFSALTDDTDPNDDDLTVTGVSTPANGTVAFTAAGLITYTPTPGYSGDDTFTYTISDGRGGTDTATVSVTVANQAPVAVDDTATAGGIAGSAISIDVLANDTDPNDDPLTVDDVATPAHGTATVAADGTIRYDPDDDYAGGDIFTYTVSDGRGGLSTATIRVDVQNRIPVARADSATASSAMPTEIDVLGNDTDADGEQLTVASVDAASAHGGTVSLTDDGVSYTSPVGFTGQDTFSYTVTDPRGGRSTAVVTVTVSNANPVAPNRTLTSPPTGNTINLRSGASDPDGQPVTVSSVGTAAHGVVTLDGNGVATYTPNPGYGGPDSFTYTVSDGNGGTATGTVSVTVSNQDPTAADFAVEVPGGTASVVDVLAHAGDPNGDILTVSEVGTAAHGTVEIDADGQVVYTPDNDYAGPDSFTYTVGDASGGTATGTVTVTVSNQDPMANDFGVTAPGGAPRVVDVLAHADDPNGDTLTVSGLGTAEHGTVVLDDGEVVYTPEDGFAGVDSFTYTVDDGNGGFATGTVTVTVSNQDPTADDFAVTVPGGAASEVDVLAHAGDPNGETLTVSEVGTAAHGTVVINADGKVVYTPANGFAGSDTFTYTVDDGNGGFATGTVTVTVSNQDPTADDFAVTVPGGAASEVDVLAHADDPNGETLTVSEVGTAAHGTVVINADGKVVYTPANGFAGSDTFTYTVDDGNGGFATGTVTVTVSNQGPTAANFAVTVPRDAPTAVDVLAHASDPNDDDELTISAVSRAAHGSVTIDGEGKVVYTPNDGYLGPDSFTYTVTDGQGGTDTGTVTITVVNEPPVAVDDTASMIVNGSVDLDVLANDSDPNPNDILTFTDAPLTPLHGTAVISGGSITYTPDPDYTGVDSFDYEITDGIETATATVTVTVTAPTPGPSNPTDPASGDPTTSNPNGGGDDLANTGGPTLGVLGLGAGLIVFGLILLGGRQVATVRDRTGGRPKRRRLWTR